MHAAKHFDPQLGVDIHFYIVTPLPAPPPPIPLPTVHISMVFDPFDYVPIIGGTVQVNGVKRATAGTQGITIHIPLSVYHPIALPMVTGPQKDDEIFMGSMTVVADGDPLSRITMPVLDCNMVGMIFPFRPKKPKIPQRSMVLPTALNLAIPNSVFVGGPPMISIMGLAFKGAFSALGKLKKLKRVQAAMAHAKSRYKSLFKNMDSGFLKCKVLRAEPVDIRTGAVEVTHEDFSVPGRLPLTWTRRYRSDDLHPGLCGHGWQTIADSRLELYADGSAMFFGAVGVFAVFDRVPQFLRDDIVEDGFDGVRLTRVAAAQTFELHVRSKDDVIYVFEAPPPGTEPSAVGGMLQFAIQRLQDLNGNYWRFERQDGELIRINESGVDGVRGRFLDVSTQRSRIHHIALHDPANGITYPLVRYEQDSAGDLVAVYDALDAARTFQYQASPHPHHMVRHTDRVGLSFYYAYDDKARVVRAWGDGGLHKYRFAYNDLINETQVTDSLDHTSLVKFDADGLPLCEIDPLGGCTFFEYDGWARTTAISNPEGLRTEFAYDERGNLTRIVRPDGSVVTVEYNSESRALAVTDPCGARWRRYWNERGLLIEETSPLGAKTTYDYDAAGQLIRRTNPRGAVTQLAFDRNGQLKRVTDALGYSVNFDYDALGRLLERIDVVGHHISYRYDRKGRLLESLISDDAIVRCEYDAEDQLVRHIDQAGNETRLEYSGIGQIACRRLPDGRSVRYEYDTEEQLAMVINQRGERYGLRRDALGRIITEIDYWGQTRHYSYDSAGRIRRSVDALGRSLVFETDQLGRIVQKTSRHATDFERQLVDTFRYDKSGQLVEVSNDSMQITRQFDAEGRLVQETQNGFRIQSEYDAVGSRTLRTTSAGNRVAIDYDLLDAPICIAINDESPIIIERDATGRVVNETLNERLRRTFGYTDDGLMTEKTLYKDSAPIFDTRFEYDRGGNLTKRIDSKTGTDTYRYDPMGRVLEHIDPAGMLTPWLNDPAGDRLQTQVKQIPASKVVGGEDAVDWTREGRYDSFAYVFDRAGNLISRTHDREGVSSTLYLKWDTNQRLVESQLAGESTLYGYDPLGRRIYKKGPAQTTRFYWDGDCLLGESTRANEAVGAQEQVDGSAKVVDLLAARKKKNAADALHQCAREYIYYPSTFVPLALIFKPPELMMRGDHGAEVDADLSSICYYHVDPNGSATQVINAAGNTVWSARYAAWGSASARYDASIDNPLRLQGQYFDAETGLHYNRHRYYDAAIGQFVSQDPLGLVPTDNPYELAANATGWADPLGLSGKKLGSALTAAGDVKPGPGYEAHHIIMEGSSDPRMKQLRTLMANHGLDVNGVENGVWLPRNDTVRVPGELRTNHRGGHGVHGEAYKQDVYDRLMKTKNADEFVEAMADIGNDMLDGKRWACR